MKIYIDMLMVAIITIYIIDLSGFTQSWRSALKRWLQVEIRQLKPFDCSQCMTWWLCLLWALCQHQFSLITITFAALLAFLSIPIGQLMVCIREWVCNLINRIMP